MDHLRVLLVPFRPTSLLTAAVFTLLISFLLRAAAFVGSFGIMTFIVAMLLNVWVLKYCFVMIEHIANGATEPPVMDADTISPFETRPLTQAAVLGIGAVLCWKIGGQPALWLASLLLLTLPAQVSLVAMGDNVFRALNPLAWVRVVRGMGAWYALLLGVLAAAVGLNVLTDKLTESTFITVAVFLFSEIAFFGLIGAVIWLRRQPLGFEPTHSPERSEARAESERTRLRAAMLDEVFQQARMGKHVDATAPLARWLRDLDAEYAARDSSYVAEQAFKWQLPLALNPVGSTLIRHLLRFGRADAALKLYEQFRLHARPFTMDSVADLRILADYAESVGKQELATSMRLETPIHHPVV